MDQKEIFGRFHDLGELFEVKYIEKEQKDKYPNYENDWREALKRFLDAYAFEREGGFTIYSNKAIETVENLKNPIVGERNNIVEEAWKDFRNRIGNERPNTKNNPMAPKGTSYKDKKKTRKTSGESVIEFLKKYGRECDYNIFSFAIYGLESNIKGTYNYLTNINGIDAKIVSLFLRDVKVNKGIELPPKIEERMYLQPIDIWVRRCCYEINKNLPKPEKDNPKPDKKPAKYIVEKSLEFGFSPEKVNMGMWYFPKEICMGDKYKFEENIKNENINEVISKHFRTMNKMIDKGKEKGYIN